VSPVAAIALPCQSVPYLRNPCPTFLIPCSEVYGDPLEHPQTETYWGNVNPIGERSCYDEGKRAAECLAMDYYREHGTQVRWVERWRGRGSTRRGLQDLQMATSGGGQRPGGPPRTTRKALRPPAPRRPSPCRP
jgi:hypothetical protein